MITLALATIVPVSAAFLGGLLYSTVRGQAALDAESQRHMLERGEEEGLVDAALVMPAAANEDAERANEQKLAA